jgi:ornithine cyclodeaminase/alanine dehydrogenase
MKNPEKILYLSRADVESVGLGMDEIIELVERVFVEKAEGRVEMPPKPGIHPEPDSFIHAMPAYVPALDAAAVKWVSGYPRNPGRGLPYITGVLILNDPATGVPIAFMDATWITAMRTAAASAVAAKYLANPNPRALAIIGCGVQGRSHIEAMAVEFPSLATIKAYDISAENLDACIGEMSEKYPNLNFERCGSAREAVDDADMIVTAGPIKMTPEPGIEPGWVKPGAFAAPVDFDTYWHRDALAEFDKILTDDIPQFRFYQEAGYFADFPGLYADLSDVVSQNHAGALPGRTDGEERIMAMHLGLAMEDAVVARKLYIQAVRAEIGQWLDH